MQLGKVEFPEQSPAKDDSRHLIAKLLRWKSSERLGVIAKVSDHHFLPELTPEKSDKKEYNPPFKVDQRNLDTNISLLGIFV